MSTPEPAQITVFTFKDGLLARLAHDLRLSLGRFEIRRDGTALSGRFWPASLKVDGVVGKDGRVDVEGLGASDKAKIQRNITDEILLTAQHPEVSFAGALTPGGVLDGRLVMLGKTVPVRAPVRVEGDRLHAEFTLVPSQWGIAPYKALAGAIKLQDRLVVALDLPADPDAGGEATPDPCTWKSP
ncbi:YceI family protein [Nannocystis bainbridge]|uniref:YceI family protein n=1 Tax=Nannocystis bainbridge TaxID=2995303 RepID=A0ABT5E2B0_9BACT|nr:YceI family protein [Nannocystis bainbridge]MDC0718892.1 YceI family protein [Nannocystis bainbridge]